MATKPIPLVKLDANFQFMKRTMALSASKIECFYQCQNKFREEYIFKSVPFVESPEIIRGKDEHEQFEIILKTAGAGILDLANIGRLTLNSYALDMVEKIFSSPGTVQAESKFGIYEGMQACDPTKQNWDKQPNGMPYLLTGSKDVCVRNGIYSTILDWKSGKVYQQPQANRFNANKVGVEKAIAEKRLQLDIYALAEFIENPECQYIKGMYVFYNHDKTIEYIYQRSKDEARIREYLQKAIDSIWFHMTNWSNQVGGIVTNPTRLCGWCGAAPHCTAYQNTGAPHG